MKQPESSASVTYKLISTAQNSALDYLAEASGSLDLAAVSTVNKEVFFIPYVNFALHPSSDTLSFFSKLTVEYGLDDHPFLPEKSISYYILHPKKALREFKLSVSKIIWLKGLLRIPLPYYGIFWLMRRVFKVKGYGEKQRVKILEARSRKEHKK